MYRNMTKNPVHEKPKVTRPDNAPFTSISNTLLLMLKSGEVFIGYYVEVEGKDIFHVNIGKAKSVIVPEDNPVILWRYLESFPLMGQYQCRCEGYNERRNDGWYYGESHMVGTFGCKYKICSYEDEPKSLSDGNWCIYNPNHTKVSAKDLHKKYGYHFSDGCWKRLKTKDEMKAEYEYYQWYIKNEPIRGELVRTWKEIEDKSKNK